TGMALNPSPETMEELLTLGQSVYERRCIGCHGAKGDGNGPSAVFLNPRPRDFTRGIFKFRSTPDKDTLPTDVDLYLTVTDGLWGDRKSTRLNSSQVAISYAVLYLKKKKN